MQDGPNASASFREIDEHGNAVLHHPAAAPDEIRKIRFNPFIVALWILNAALVLFVGWIMNASLGPTFYGGLVEGPANGPLFVVLMNSLPQMLPLPLLTTVALLFWHSWQWQKRRGHLP